MGYRDFGGVSAPASSPRDGAAPRPFLGEGNTENHATPPALRAGLCPARRRPPRGNGERFVPPSSAGTRIHHPAAPDSRPSQSPRPSRPAPRLPQPIRAVIPLPGIPRAAAEGAVTPEGRGRACACAISLTTGRKNGAIRDTARLRFPAAPGQLRMREAGLARRREGEEKGRREGAWPSEFAASFPCPAKWRGKGHWRRRCRGGRQRNAGGEGSLPARRSRRGARVQLCAARALPARVTRGSCGEAPLSVSVAFVSWNRCRVPEPAGTRLCGGGGAGKTSALLNQNNVRFLPLVFWFVFLADVSGNPLI